MLTSDQKRVAMSKLALFRLEALLDLLSDLDESGEGSPTSFWHMTNNIHSLLEVALDLFHDLHYKIRDDLDLSNDLVADCLEQYIKELSNNATNNPS